MLQFPAMDVRLSTLAVWLLVAGSLLTPAAADEWNYAARAGLSSVYDDNPTLTEDSNIDSTFRFLAFYEMDIETRRDNTVFEISPRVSRDYYPDSEDSDLESTDYEITGTWSTVTPTSRWNVNFRTSEENILSTDTVAETGITDTTADDSRTIYSVSPSVTWTPTPKDSLIFGLNWNKIDFDKDFTNRNDSETTGANFSYLRAITQKQSLGLTGRVTSSERDNTRCTLYTYYIDDAVAAPRPSEPPCDEFPDNSPNNLFPVFAPSGALLGLGSNADIFPSPDDYLFTQNILSTSDSDTDTYSVTLDYQYTFSPLLSISLSAGREKTKTSNTLEDINGTTLLQDSVLVFLPPNNFIVVNDSFVSRRKTDAENETYNVRVTKLTERSEFVFVATRGTFLETSRATPQDREVYELRAKTEWTDKLRSEINLRYTDQESVFESASSDDTNLPQQTSDTSISQTKFYSGQFILKYNLTRKWSMQTSYRYRERERTFSGSTATSSTISAAVVYNFKRIPTR